LLLGWRALFLITGGFGIIWLIIWLFFTSGKPLNEEAMPVRDKLKNKGVPFIALLKNRQALTFIVIRFLLDPIFYFYMFWIPKYLNESRAFSLESIGDILWIPFLALGAGNFLGGWISDVIFRRTNDTNKARKRVMGVAAALTMPVLTAGFLNSDALIIIFMSLAFFAHGLWITNYITSIGDVFGSAVTSTVVGLSGSAGALSSLVLNPVIGLIVTRFSYTPLWWYAGLMYPVAFLIFVMLIPDIRNKFSCS